jgi:hypothetical protein
MTLQISLYWPVEFIKKATFFVRNKEIDLTIS